MRGDNRSYQFALQAVSPCVFCRFDQLSVQASRRSKRLLTSFYFCTFDTLLVGIERDLETRTRGGLVDRLLEQAEQHDAGAAEPSLLTAERQPLQYRYTVVEHGRPDHPTVSPRFPYVDRLSCVSIRDGRNASDRVSQGYEASAVVPVRKIPHLWPRRSHGLRASHLRSADIVWCPHAPLKDETPDSNHVADGVQ